MNKSIIILTLLIPFAFIGLQSYENGPTDNVGNRTGSNGLKSGCSSCHGNKNAATIVNIEFLDQGNVVHSYIPGSTYDVKLTAVNTHARPAFGFQITGGSANPSNTLYGTFDNSEVANTSLKLSKQLVEHSNPLDGEIIGDTSHFSRTFKWIAPVKGSGDLRFYAAVNAVNHNGDNDNNDNWNLGTSEIITENSGSAGTASSGENLNLYIFPNPASDKLHIQLPQPESKEYTIRVINMRGQEAIRSVARNTRSIYILDIHTLLAGYYIIMVESNQQTYSSGLIKV
ncbi:MAG: T9SS type A sorting domain-containing protein [Saprospiraceae bacterium]|nr:T9SS type A sorting domain-containing protein [Saprospiraceae bacterium]